MGFKFYYSNRGIAKRKDTHPKRSCNYLQNERKQQLVWTRFHTSSGRNCPKHHLKHLLKDRRNEALLAWRDTDLQYDLKIWIHQFGRPVYFKFSKLTLCSLLTYSLWCGLVRETVKATENLIVFFCRSNVTQTWTVEPNWNMSSVTYSQKIPGKESQ